MKPKQTETTNTNFIADGCFDLPGTKYILEDGTPGIETCWELTDEEIQEITKNKCVFVCMLGQTVPPMNISVHSLLRKEGQE